MILLFLDLSPNYIPFLVQCTKAAGDKIDPTVDNLIIYEESGADAVFDSTQITGSPFDPAKINSKTGLWGVLIAKTAFTAGKFYIALWEMTVDGVITAKVERYFVCNASQFKADISGLASQTSVDNVITYIQNVLLRLGDFAGSGLNTILGFLRAIMRKDEGILPSQVEGTYDNQTDSLQALRDNPGGGGSSIILPVMQGAVYSSLAVQGKEVNIVRGDTPTIYFDLDGDYTGWTAKFGAKVNLKDTEYVIAPKSCVWTDASKGEGYFELTSTETANEAKLFGEIELTKDTKHLTAMRFILRIIEDVIK